MVVQTDFQLSDADFQTVRDAVYKYCGISLNYDKKALVRARLAKQMRKGGFGSVEEYLNYAMADRNSEGFIGLIDAISTNLTSFFRENEHFKFLTERALPTILQNKRKVGENRILAWSAACSSGEEPYSLSITFLEALEKLKPESLDWQPRILATDISTKMLAKARAGIYGTEQVATVPPQFREKYFTPAGTDHGISPAMRRMVTLRRLNLMDRWPFQGPFDVIFCRNVMIYFDHATQQKLVDRFWNCLSPGGYLFTGHSESLTRIRHKFTHRQASIYEKVC